MLHMYGVSIKVIQRIMLRSYRPSVLTLECTQINMFLSALSKVLSFEERFYFNARICFVIFCRNFAFRIYGRLNRLNSYIHISMIYTYISY